MQDAENKSIIGELTLCNLYKIVLGLRKKKHQIGRASEWRKIHKKFGRSNWKEKKAWRTYTYIKAYY